MDILITLKINNYSYDCIVENYYRHTPWRGCVWYALENILFIDESMAVQILFILIYYMGLFMDLLMMAGHFRRSPHRPLQPLSHDMSDSGDMEVIIDHRNTETWQGHLHRNFVSAYLASLPSSESTGL